MKKIVLFLSPLIFVFVFLCFGKSAFANPDYTPRNEGWDELNCNFISNKYTGGSTYYLYDLSVEKNTQYSQQYGICAYYNRSWDSSSQAVTEGWVFCNVYDLVNSIHPTNEPFAYWTEREYTTGTGQLHDTRTGSMINTNVAGHYGEQIIIPTGYGFEVNFPLFADYQSAYDYFRYGILPDDPEDAFRYGYEYFESPITIGSKVYSPSSIPAPRMEFVPLRNNGNVSNPDYDNFTHKIHFINPGYYGEHDSQMRYGLALTMSWWSIGSATIQDPPNLVGSESYPFTLHIDSVIHSGSIEINPFPSTTHQYTPSELAEYECPEYLDLDTNAKSVNGFNSFLNLNPVVNRTINVGTLAQRENLDTTFRSRLGLISSPFNRPHIRAQYYIIDDNGVLHYGPYTDLYLNVSSLEGYKLSTIGTLGSSAGNQDVEYVDPETDESLGQVITPPPSDNGSNDGFGGITPTQDFDAAELRQNLHSLFGFLGEVPQFVSQIFLFLPHWLITFIAVAIALMIAIGIFKTLIG